MSTSLRIDNLFPATTGDTLREEFSAFGEVTDVSRVTDRTTGRPYPFAFVTMGSPAQARTAIQQLHGKSLDGREVEVTMAEGTAPRASSTARRRNSGG